MATRLRLVNRFFAADESPPHELASTLDRDVTVIDTREAEEELTAALAGARSIEDMHVTLTSLIQSAVQRAHSRGGPRS